MADNLGLEEVEYTPAKKLKKPEEKEQPTGIASRAVGVLRGAGGYVKREVQGEVQAGKDIVRASPRLAGNALIAGAKEAKAGTEIAGWAAGKEIGFREWQAKRAEAKAKKQEAEARQLQTSVTVEKAKFDLIRLREAESAVKNREMEHRRMTLFGGMMPSMQGSVKETGNIWGVRHPLESLPIGGMSHISTGKKHRAGKKHKHKSSRGKKVTFTDSKGKKVSFTAKG